MQNAPPPRFRPSRASSSTSRPGVIASHSEAPRWWDQVLVLARRAIHATNGVAALVTILQAAGLL